ncbi:hypothetical protein FV222_02475 [Methylobacterium sp. WL103]|uniref:hypothetical protein n=1 Tax=Methylobacterium sp. WL103 TaxID=2603891 RepID=UPI0011CC9135|nr:hypothetical protein [Methylobacterium sp. WL103]TXN07386.1 hypothetical protein FV222_02475 [Methylobacterium sp. WL103]
MSANVINFLDYQSSRRGPACIAAWVPDIAHNIVDGRCIPYWSGREVLCQLVPNPKYRGKLISCYLDRVPELPFKYVYMRGEDGNLICRPAFPPECDVDAYDWEDFERKAFSL